MKSGDSFIFFRKREKENGVVIAKDSASGNVLWESVVDVSENPEITVTKGILTIRDRLTGKSTVLDLKSGKQIRSPRGRSLKGEYSRDLKGETPAAGTSASPLGDWPSKDLEGSKEVLEANDKRSQLEALLKKLDYEREDVMAKLNAERARVLDDLKRLEDPSRGPRK